MKTAFYNSGRDHVTSELSSLSKKLGKTYRKEAKGLPHSAQTVAETAALHVALSCLQETKYAVDQTLSAQRLSPQTAAAFLEEQIERVRRVTQKEELNRYLRAGDVSIQTMNLLFLAENEIAEEFPIQRSYGPAKVVATRANLVTITSDLLYQAHHHILPAEKMLVASGQRADNRVTIGAIFEVTGDHSMGHVRANPSRLARALISMDLTTTHFAMWLHSHPGVGKEATRPSTTDLAQHVDWLRDYSPNLISAIMVEDRWIRFWGTAIETGKAKIEILGSGITMEVANELYRLEQ